MADHSINNDHMRTRSLQGNDIVDASKLKNNRNAGEIPLPTEKFSKSSPESTPLSSRPPNFSSKETVNSPQLQESGESPQPQPVSGGEPVSIKIIHTNDLHGSVLPKKDKEFNTEAGGQEYFSTIIKEERKDAAIRNEKFLLLDAGDMTRGTPIAEFFKGMPMIGAMNKEGYDAAVMGNHEFDWGIGHFKNIVQHADFPFLGANLFDDKNKELPGVSPYIIKDLGGVKVGIIGVTTTEIPQLTSQDKVRNMKIKDPIETISATIPKAKEDGAEMIIVLSHAGLEQDKKIARLCNGIDLIVGGHSHIDLEKPITENGTLIVQAGKNGRKIGKIEVDWDPEKKKIISSDGKLTPVIKDEINPDVNISKLISKYKKKLDSIFDVKLGEVQEDITLATDTKESKLGDVITDLMRKKTGAQIAFLNDGTLRADLLKGDIKYGDIYSIIPFESKIVELEMSGKSIMQTLEEAAGEDHGSLQVSGLNIIYDSTKPIGERIISAKTDDGKLIEPDGKYTVTTLEYLAKGGDKHEAFKSSKVLNNNAGILQEAVAEKIKEEPMLGATIMGRIQDIKDNPEHKNPEKK